MSNRAILLAGLALAGVTACGGHDDMIAPAAHPPGAMSYTAYDQDGRAVVVGWIRLDLAVVQASSMTVTGDWSLTALVDPERVGLRQRQSSGRLEGSLSDGHLDVALFPGVADAGCNLSGTLVVDGGPAQSMRYSGTWSDQSISGPRHSGTFRADG